MATAQTLPLVNGYIYTYAGAGDNLGDGGPAIDAEFFNPNSATLDAAGNLYIADSFHGRIRKIDASSGIITTVAGNGVMGYGGDGGPATAASLNSPQSVAFDAAGDLYIADFANSRVRRVDAKTGIITTVAGTGGSSYSGDGGPAINAGMNGPYVVAFDAAGNFYIQTSFDNCIRKVDIATGIISTFAGVVDSGGTYGGDGGPAVDAQFNYPYGMAFDAAGNLLIADTYNNRIRRIDASTGIITTIIGNGTQGYAGDGGPAIDAEFHSITGITFDLAGNLYIADANNNRVRVVAASTGVITTIAGDGTAGASGDNGPAIDAELAFPTGVAIGPSGFVYIVDNDTGLIRIVRPDNVVNTTTNLSATPTTLTAGQTLTLTATVTAASGSTPTGTVTFLNGAVPLGSATLNGTGIAPLTLKPAAGSYSITAVYAGASVDAPSTSSPPVAVTVEAIATTTALTASATTLTAGLPLALTATVDAASGPTPTGTVTFYNGTTSLGTGILNAGGIATLTLAPSQGTYSIIASYAGSATDAASVSAPPVIVTVNAVQVNTGTSLTASPARLDVGQTLTLTATVSASSGAIPTGTVTFSNGATTLGTGTLNPSGVATLSLSPAAGSYSIIASYSGNSIDAFSASPPVSVEVTNTANSPDIYTFAGDGVKGYEGDTGLAVDAELSMPWSLTSDAAGNVYIADGGNNRVRKVNAATGVITTFAGTGSAGYSGDGGPAAQALLDNPVDVTLDKAGNLYIADAWNACIRKVDATTGVITTVAGTCGVLGESGTGGPAANATLILPLGVALDASGNLYISDDSRVHKVNAATGIITTFAGTGQPGTGGDGGPATAAQLEYPIGLAVDTAGDLYIVDPNANEIRKVDGVTGIMSTVAGTGPLGFSVDGGLAINSELAQPNFVKTDAAGNVYFSDSSSGRIRIIDAQTGILTTYAGNGDSGFSGDGGPAIDATMNYPQGLAFDASGNLFIADSFNYRVRIVGQKPVYTSLPATTTTLTASATSLTAGQPLTLTATVTAASGPPPAGTVTFNSGTTSLGAGTLNGSGVATLTPDACRRHQYSAYTHASYAGLNHRRAIRLRPAHRGRRGRCSHHHNSRRKSNFVDLCRAAHAYGHGGRGQWRHTHWNCHVPERSNVAGLRATERRRPGNSFRGSGSGQLRHHRELRRLNLRCALGLIAACRGHGRANPYDHDDRLIAQPGSFWNCRDLHRHGRRQPASSHQPRRITAHRHCLVL